MNESEARALLYERVTQLRVALEQAGIHVDRFEVTTDFGIDKPPDSSQGNVSGDSAGVPARTDRREPRDGSPGSSAETFLEDPVASAESEVTTMASDVAEARLDIRV